MALMDPTAIHSKHFPIHGSPATEFLCICIILPKTSKFFMPHWLTGLPLPFNLLFCSFILIPGVKFQIPVCLIQSTLVLWFFEPLPSTPNSLSRCITERYWEKNTFYMVMSVNSQEVCNLTLKKQLFIHLFHNSARCWARYKNIVMNSPDFLKLTLEQ